MGCLFVINATLSSHTDRFWKRIKTSVLHSFPDASYFVPDSFNSTPNFSLDKHEIIVFVGDDIFFNRSVNNFFHLLTENFGRNILAFIPVAGNSALTDGLGFPKQLQRQLELIKSKQSIPLDLIRCHYIDKHGFPASHLILNDAVVGLPLLKFPSVLKNIVRTIKSRLISSTRQNRKNIKLISDDRTIYEGSYVFGLVLLGKRITKGPKVRTKERINLNKFEYVQLNTNSLRQVTSVLPDLISGRFDDTDANLFHANFNELEIKAFGNGNKLIADGIYLGRLPATFTLLPKAIRVISPLITVKIQKPWRDRLAAKIPNPMVNYRLDDPFQTYFSEKFPPCSSPVHFPVQFEQTSSRLVY